MLVSCFVVARILVFLKVSETHLRIECPGGLVNLHKGKSFLVDERLVRSYQTNLQRRWEDCYVKEGCVNTGGGEMNRLTSSRFCCAGAERSEAHF